ncbi:MAG TPA: SusD/RagB family nutrient-binding outer membrane lipoprotein, partial [Chitinophagaceae bacterium]|nr:SusD/RagB family nutrient-binding outer membrane lipoprotein [Chitinophagaceae bacterium]
EIEKIYNGLSEEDKADRRIYLLAATVFLYDQTAKMVDLHGDLPFTEAGMLSSRGGAYQQVAPKYDKAEDLYTLMLDGLKTMADELNTITVKPGILTGFATQDLINKGSLDLWKRYTNSLRLRLLTRVSLVPAFQGRANTEIAAILGNATQYPVVTSNTENILIRVQDLNTDLNARGFRTGLEDWNGNIAGKKMIDHMNANNDPRLRVLFEPGANSPGVYTGLDPLASEAQGTDLINAGTLAIYNRSTLSRNEFFPGVLITASEVSFLAAEHYARAGSEGAAQTAYERGIRQSVEFYYWIRTLSNDNTAGPVAAPTQAEVDAYIASADVAWSGAGDLTQKIGRIALQKWIHFNVVQPLESWAEIRRLDAPALVFQQDAANAQKQPPARWFYPTSEMIYNGANYEAVKAKDNLTTRIFWDLQ